MTPRREWSRGADVIKNEGDQLVSTRDYQREPLGFGDLGRYPPEPYRIKAVQPLPRTSRCQRGRLLRKAGLNPFLLRSRDVTIDLLTDSGTGSMSDAQWGAIMTGDEAYAGSDSYFLLEETVERILGFPHVLPTHQGRGAEHLLFRCLVGEGDVVVNNMHFDTTKAHVLHRGAVPLNLVREEAFDPGADLPFKGDMDLDRLEAALADPDLPVSVVMCTVTCNTGGGQPVSMENLRGIRDITARHGVPFYLDACRFAENAMFIQKREPGYGDRTVGQIVREMMGLADGATVSGKKDALVNIGGFLATRDPELHRQASEWAVLFEGFPTYGGLAGRDMAAMARGLEEVVEAAYLEHRLAQVAYLADRLSARDVPIMKPPGGHAVYLDALGFLPGVERDLFPGFSLSVALYLAGGVRVVEIGTVLSGRDPKTGEHDYPPLELVRLAVPRRTYTYRHMDQVAEAVAFCLEHRRAIGGLEFTYEPPVLRHFSARFRPTGEWGVPFDDLQE